MPASIREEIMHWDGVRSCADEQEVQSLAPQVTAFSPICSAFAPGEACAA